MKTKRSIATWLAVPLCRFTLNKIPVLIAMIAMPLRAAQPQPGSVDLSFDAGELTGGVPQVFGFTVIENMSLLPNGRVYIGGHLDSVQGVPRDGIARLLPNGLLDTTFQEHGPEFSLSGDTHRLFLQSDGKLLAGYYCVRRFHPDGTGDSSLTNCPNVIAMLPDGRFLATTNEFPSRPFRLFSDGTRDPSFTAAVELNGVAPPMLIESDGRIVLSACVETGLADRLVRLLPDGALDPSFKAVTLEPSPELGVIHTRALARPADGRYLLAGDFYSINNQRGGMIVRLNTDGTLDTSLNIAADLFLQGEPNEPGDYVLDLAAQPDGKILVGGYFGNPRSVSYGGLLRLNADGSLDTSFSVGAGAWFRNPDAPEIDHIGFVKRILLQPDGQILVSGDFNEFGAVTRQYIARLYGDSPLLRLSFPQILPDGRIQISVADFTGQTTVVEAACELSPPNWRPIWTNMVSSGSFTVTDVDPSNSPRRYYRALAR
jgi:uncharacterized delta-60 repeat protein